MDELEKITDELFDKNIAFEEKKLAEMQELLDYLLTD